MDTRTWLRHWYENIAVPNVRYKTRTYYQTAIFKYLIPGIGRTGSTSLSPSTSNACMCGYGRRVPIRRLCNRFTGHYEPR